MDDLDWTSPDWTSVAEASELLGEADDLEQVLGNLLLVAMSRLLVTRGAVLLAPEPAPGQAPPEAPVEGLGAEGRGPEARFEVGAVKGATALAPGQALDLPVPAAPVAGADVCAPLREAGLALVLPVRHDGRPLALVGLGPKLSGAPFAPGEVAFARSLVGLSGAAIHNARVARQLREANRALAGRVHELHTLFELAQAFGTAFERGRAAKLLTYALLGQLPSDRHLVLLRPRGDAEGPLETVLARGLPPGADGRAAPGGALADALATLDAPWLAGTPAARAHPLADALAGAGLALAVPLRMHRALRGVVAVGPRATGRPYTRDDVAFVTALGALALAAIENADLLAARLEKERLEEEMRFARTIQERLLPRERPRLPGLDAAALAWPSRHVAGDYFELAALDDHRLLVAVADVSGKGMPAALLMANLQAGLHVVRHALDPEAPDLAGATARLNRMVCANTDAASFITFVWGVLDARDGRFRYVNAGHNPPRLVRAGGAVETLDEGGLLLGVLTGAAYAQGEVALAPGDLLALYTDGATEARAPDGEEYGEDRLDALLVRHRAGPADAALAALRADLDAFTAGAPLADDLTLVAVRREA